jgi:hypothetical protein
VAQLNEHAMRVEAGGGSNQMGGQQGRNDAGRGSPVHQHRAWQDARSTLKKYVKNNIFISEKEYCFSTLFIFPKKTSFLA